MLMMYLSMVDTQEEKTKIEEIYIRYRKLMFVCANEILQNDFLAEDAVHDAFVKMTGHVKKIDDVNSNKTKHFVIVVVENAAKDIYRREKRREHENWEKLENAGCAFVAYHPAELEQPEIAILKLPLKYQHVFRLKYICGYDYEEVAKILGITNSAVRKRISRGKEMLKGILEDMGVDVDEKCTDH